MSQDALPLPIHPWPRNEHGDFLPLEPERSELLREAKAGINTPIRIYPVPAVPGSPGRTLAFGSIPPHVSESALIRPENVDKVESVRAALTAILTAPAGAPGFFTHVDWMLAAMPGAKYIGEEQLNAPEPRETLRFY